MRGGRPQAATLDLAGKASAADAAAIISLLHPEGAPTAEGPSASAGNYGRCFCKSELLAEHGVPASGGDIR